MPSLLHSLRQVKDAIRPAAPTATTVNAANALQPRFRTRYRMRTSTEPALGSSHVTRYWAELRGLVRQVDEFLIDIAPSPALRRIIPFDDRIAGRVNVGSCMLSG